MYPAMNSIRNLECAFHRLVGDRLTANLNQWLLCMPYANPGIVEKMRMREYGYDDKMVIWYGEFAGKHLTAAVLAWQITRSKALGRMIADLVEELSRVQDADGYLGPYGSANRYVGNVDQRVWDLWGHYHVMLGLLLWHEASGERLPLDMCVKAADGICNFFLDGDRSILEAGYSEMNTAVIHMFGLLYGKFGNKRYLRMMRHVESAWDDEKGGGYVTAALAGQEFYQTRKPRWESLHPIQGILQLFLITGDARYEEAFKKLWHSMNEYDCHNTGGFSSGEQACGNPFDPGAIETCCTVAWSVLSVDMLRLTGDSLVADQLELALYNAVIAAQSPSGRWWTYNTPMDGVREASAHSIVFQALAGSPEINCCSVNGPRALALTRDWAFMESCDAIAVNYYGPGTFSMDGEAKIRILTKYPYANKVKILIDTPVNKKLNLRIPAWSRNTRVRINAESAVIVEPGKYFHIDRSWNAGDVIEMIFDFAPRLLFGKKECENKISIYRGPLLLAYDEIHNGKPISVVPEAIPEDIAFGAPIHSQNSRYARPGLLLPVGMGNGKTAYLCDFASAGISGSRYLSWMSIGGHENFSLPQMQMRQPIFE